MKLILDTIHLSFHPSAIRSDTTVNLMSIDFGFFLSEQQLVVNLTEGEIIYDACPVCDLADDDTSTSVFLGTPDNLPASVQVDSMTGASYNVTRSPTPLTIQNQTDYLVARVALSNDAVGSWNYIGNETSLVALLPSPPTLGGIITGGVMTQVPEPSSMALLSAIGMI